MHQFMIEPLFGTDHLSIGGYNIAFTNSALWMLIAAVALWIFMLGGMKRQLVPGRWQAAVESMTSFISNMMRANIGEEGRKFTPYVFSLFMFILFANLLGMLPLGLVGEIGRASGRERVCQYGEMSGVAVSLKKKKQKT